MKRVRFLIIAIAGAVGVGLMAGFLAFNSGVQTYFAWRALAARPDLHATLGRIAAGWQHVEVQDVRFEQDGAVLILPRLEADLPVLSAGLSQKVLISRLVAGGWTLDLSRPAPKEPASVSVAAADAPAAVAAAFSGVLRQIQLPVDLAIEALQLEGDVILPELRGRVRVVIQGGGLGAGRDGRFEIKADADLTDPAVSAVRIAGALTATMDTPRSLARLELKLDATARGTKFPQGVKLSGELAAARAAAGETYRVTVVTPERQLVLVQAGLPAGARQLDGTWQLEVRDADVAPFALGRALPAFAISGGGSFDTDAALTSLHAAGRLNAALDRLEVVAPQLARLGAVGVSAEFDLARDRDRVRVQSLQARLSAVQPVATLRALQAFDVETASGAIKPSAPDRELFDLVLDGVPLSWTGPLVPGLELSGDGVRGEFTALARGDGFSLRTRTPLTAANLAASWQKRAMITAVDFETRLAADYTSHGWQAEIDGLNAKTGGVTWLRLSGKAGQLGGVTEPLKATGALSLDLPAVLAQPAAVGTANLASGEAKLDFIASLAARDEFAVNLTLRQLATAAERLPDVSTQLRVDVSASGQMAVNAPIHFEQEGRKSDLTIAGTLQPGPDGLALEADIVSLQLHVADARLFAALVPETAPTGGAAATAAAPPWAGVRGTVALHVKKAIYSDLFEVSDVEGKLQVEPGVLKLAGFKAGLGQGGSARLDGELTFLRATPEPYALEAALAVTAFDPAPFFRSLNPGQPSTVEGRFNIESKLLGRGATLAALAGGAGGDFQLTSTGGTFRGLPVSAAARLEATGAFAAGIAKLGNLANAISGKNDRAIENIANKAQAIAELANYWKAIPYDQLSVTLARDADQNATLKNFTLISPELRLSGQGEARHRPGAALLDEELAMEFKLRARGHHAGLLKYVGVLEESADELGYAACTLPLKVSGTLGKPDTTELNEKLAALALEKGGVSDKALELLNRLRGGSKP